MLDVTNDPYVEARDGNFYVGKTRVTLETVVLYWKQGNTPEYIHDHFPTVPLASIFGAIAYYLSHQTEVDAELAEAQANADHLYAELERNRPEAYARLHARLASLHDRKLREQVSQDDPETSPSAEHQSA